MTYRVCASGTSHPYTINHPQTLPTSGGGHCCPLSQRERVRVREKFQPRTSLKPILIKRFDTHTCRKTATITHQHTRPDPTTFGPGSEERLGRSDRFYETTHRQIVEWLSPGPGSRVLDAGCGTAGFTQLLAEAVGDGAHVDAADTSEHLLEYNRTRFAGDPVGKRIRFHEAPIQDLPFEDRAFDLVWCSRAVHHLADQLAGMRELARVVAPGGKLAIREGGVAARFMPTTMDLTGTGLNERLADAMESWFASHVHFSEDAVPYPYGWTQLLRDAGMSDVTARTFIHEFLPPFTDEQKTFLLGGLTRWATDEAREDYLPASDRTTLRRLIDPDDVEYVFNRPDLHFIEGITVYVGRRA